ncbi:hypothetical protein ERX46_05365 [Brumimicrobium glaciale]|uniref:Uncharacterized protein n=1 Tax=Brumimicrobium glaciale TaxID=200475 RepID=A0A4Q4KQE9_9FLAO|nr:hypothetical protein [Brumimicrobium glaciale]RYM34804.1 hypothetical protein ERX46_05365 [Brumimicrobium glaciale]
MKNAFGRFNNISFIEKLDAFFSVFKNKGDTSIEIHTGTGGCSCNNCRNVMCFVGNLSRDYFALSYQESERNYFSLNKTCKEIILEEDTQLNQFHYFKIKPKETTEYLQFRGKSEPFKEFYFFCERDFCNMNVIEFWLEKYAHYNSNIVASLLEHKVRFQLDPVTLLLNKEFEKLYGQLLILSMLYKKESYFKKQLSEYRKVEDSISKRREWFDFHRKNKQEYELFNAMFYDSREQTLYRLALNELVLNPEDFKYTLEFVELMEDSKAIVFEGTIKEIHEIEIFERTVKQSAYRRRRLLLEIDDFNRSEYLVTFSDGRINHLEGFIAGQYVNVLARLLGGELKNSQGNKEFQHSLFGWKIEEVMKNTENKETSDDMNLYYKYMMLPSL